MRQSKRHAERYRCQGFEGGWLGTMTGITEAERYVWYVWNKQNRYASKLNICLLSCLSCQTKICEVCACSIKYPVPSSMPSTGRFTVLLWKGWIREWPNESWGGRSTSSIVVINLKVIFLNCFPLSFLILLEISAKLIVSFHTVRHNWLLPVESVSNENRAWV